MMVVSVTNSGSDLSGGVQKSSGFVQLGAPNDRNSLLFDKDADEGPEELFVLSPRAVV